MSALDALTPEQYAQVEETVRYRRIERLLVERGLWELVRHDLVREIPVAQPSAGAEFTLAPPGGAVWVVRSIFARFITSAVVANRFASVQITDGDGNQISATYSISAQTATNTVRYQVADTAATAIAATAGRAILPVVGPFVASSWSLRSSTANMDAGDQWSQIFALVEEWTPARLVQVCASNLADLDSAGGIRYPGE